MAPERIIVIGNTCAGKSTFAGEVAGALGLKFVDLDALFWKPNWQRNERAEFRAKIVEATTGTGWVVAGNYVQHRDLTWAVRITSILVGLTAWV
jgi:adenylate kinase family enzyme